MPTNECLITGQPIQGYKEIVGGFEYSITFGSRTYRLKFANNPDWIKAINSDDKVILSAMLYNNEWPIDKEAIITSQLIQRVISFAYYPRLDDFEAQKDKLLEWFSKEGGEKFRRVKFDINNYWISYVRNKEENRGVYKALLSDKLIEESENRTLIELTPEGRERVKKTIAKSPKKIKYSFPQDKYPRVYVCHVEEDKVFAESFMHELEKYNIYPIVRGDGLKNDKHVAFSYLNNARGYIVNDEKERTADYVIFIQSTNADNNKLFSSIVDIAMEEHRKRGESNFPNFITIASIDDSNIDSHPRYHDYHSHFFDIRLLSNQDYCIDKISADWVNRVNRGLSDKRIITKIDCLEWIVNEFYLRNDGVLYLYYSRINYRIESREKLESLFDELIDDNAIRVEKFAPGFGEDKVGYKVTLLNPGLNLIEKWKQQEELSVGHKLPIIKELTSDEKVWLDAIYEKHLKREQVDVKALRYALDDKLSKDFAPYEAIDKRLALSASIITLLGIWHIHPELDLFDKFDKVLYAIKNIIAEKPGIDEITSNEILSKVPNVTLDELLTIRGLMQLFNGKLLNGHGTLGKDNPGFKITISTDEVYSTYRTYTGLYDFVCEHYNIEKETTDKGNTKKEQSKKGVFRSKTRQHIRVEKHIDIVLEAKEVAKEVGDLINYMSSEKGMMIGVLGKWGRGKTILLKALWKYLGKDENASESTFIKVDFPAWKYQHTPASWAYLYEVLAEKYYDKPKKATVIGYIEYWERLFNLNAERFGPLPILKYLISLIFAIIVSIGLIKWGSISALIGIPFISAAWLAFAKHLKKEYSTATNDLIKKYSLRNSYKETMGLQAEIHKETIDLLKTWMPINDDNKESAEVNHKRVILFVEDIDRCSEDKVIENIDALRVMLDDDDVAKRVIIVTAIDEDILKRAIRAKYFKLLQHDTDKEKLKAELYKITGEYMDKLFISAVKLGSLDAAQRDDVFTSMVKKDMENPIFTSFEDILNAKEKVDEQPITAQRTAIPNQPQDIQEPVSNGDTVPQNGDNSVKTGTNLFSTAEQPTEVKATEPPEFEQLKPEELNLLRKCIISWEGATPRRLRIFYYRYLFAKNSLINRYKVNAKENIWQKSMAHTEYMADQIIEYSKNYDAAKVTGVKEAAIAGTLPLNYFEKLDIPMDDYIELMKVLEIVIAY